MIAPVIICGRCEDGTCGALSPFNRAPNRGIDPDAAQLDKNDYIAVDGQIVAHLPRFWQPWKPPLRGDREHGRYRGPFAPLYDGEQLRFDR